MGSDTLKVNVEARSMFRTFALVATIFSLFDASACTYASATCARSCRHAGISCFAPGSPVRTPLLRSEGPSRHRLEAPSLSPWGLGVAWAGFLAGKRAVTPRRGS